jgi:hypothetical protein
MRNYLMPLADKVMLRKRFVIETVLDTLWTCPALVERHWLIRRHVFRTEPGL